MAKQSVDVLIEGGKATAAPPLGPALGPLGVNIGQVVSEINNKTAAYKGMQVPVKVTVDSETKKFEISIGTPPASALIKKEANLKKGSGNPKAEKVADLVIEQIIKIAKMKEDAMLGADMKARVKEILGTCRSMGIMVGGKPADEAYNDVVNGVYDAQIKAEKTEVTAEELKHLEEERKKLAAEMEKRRAEFEAKGKEILGTMQGKATKEIRKALADAGIPDKIVNELAPEEDDKKKK